MRPRAYAVSERSYRSGVAGRTVIGANDGWPGRPRKGLAFAARFVPANRWRTTGSGRWAQIPPCCDKTLSLHYERASIRDFGFEYPRSWIHWSQSGPSVHPSR